MTEWVLNHSLGQTAEQTPKKVSTLGMNKLDEIVFSASRESEPEDRCARSVTGYDGSDSKNDDE